MMILKIILFFLFIFSVFSFFSLAPWLPTKNKDLKRIWKIISLKKWQTFLELGCGTARVSIFLAKKYADAHIIGIELSPLFYMISKIKVYFSWQKNIQIIYGNGLQLDFKNYDIIYVFWLPETVKHKIYPKLKNELQNTARFISYTFRLTDSILQEAIHKEKDNSTIYEYSKV